jgi:putative SOS response-associated peptidase YedK
MCSQYLIKTRVAELKRKFGIIVPTGFEDEFDDLVAPRSDAPVVFNDGENIVVEKMKYGLIPSWSEEDKSKFSTHNARVETVAEKPIWKKPFRTHRALVPLSSFIEPIYVKKYAGNMVRFHQKKEQLLYAAAIYDTWINKKTGEIINSFAIVTRDSPPFVDSIGHDRCPIFLKEDVFEEWLDPKNDDADELLKLLKKNCDEVEIGVDIFRPMKPGWEKRIKKA